MVVGGDLWQWDTGRSVRLDVAGATQAHFAAAESQRAVVVDVRDGVAASGKALEAGTATQLGPDDAPTVEIAGGRLNLGVPAGKPGTKVTTGEGQPATGGREGDLYIDEATGALYKYARNDEEEN